jgi:anti-sigma regulatory factor (Ser/Thr protein kinase)
VAEFILSLSRSPDSVGLARAAVRKALLELNTDVAELSALLVDELVANAIVHGAGEVSLALEVSQECVRVAVTDEGEKLPVLRIPSPTAEGGRGLSIVNAVAAQWGVDPMTRGKSVWFELAVPL